MYIGLKLLYKHDRTSQGYLTKRFPSPSAKEDPELRAFRAEVDLHLGAMCSLSVREREREREGNRTQPQSRNRNERIRMHEICMNM